MYWDNVWWGFHGIGKKGVIGADVKKYVKAKDRKNYREKYAIELNPIYELSNYVIKVSPKLVVIDDQDYKEIDLLPSLKLVELLYSILYELSFFGGPRKRNRKRDELDKRCKKIDEAIKNGTIDQITKSQDEVKKDLLEKIEKIEKRKKKGK